MAHPAQKAEAPEQHTHPNEDVPDGPPNGPPPKDPAHYELIIDNDSGTYRPNADLIPVLKKFLNSNLPGLHVVIKACDDDSLKKIKEDQLKFKKKEGDHRVYGQGSDSGSISSSDASSLNSRAGEDGVGNHRSKADRGVEALENPRQALREALGREGKEDREKREESDDVQAATEGEGESPPAKEQ